ncbi:MAG: SDR family NAD(P)-dependent oxidoreductase [Lachnospiraceae bacterium]|nr:SDR family NAD(P)-dependent oxidoreductase [Lachnospiraceae bacterium]
MNRKKALITGASRGIGKEIALILAENGFDLYLTAYQNEDLLKQLKAEITAKFGVSAKLFICDAADASAVHEMFADIPYLDVLINNAGRAYLGLLTDMSVFDWQKIINTNLNSLFYYCKEAVPGMITRKAGKIINISSIWGECGASMEVAYSAAKAGVGGFTKALAKELAPSNIQVNAIAPGLIDTSMNAGLTKAEWDDICEKIPAGRAGTAYETAQMVMHILNAPDYLTGQIIRMDGGLL